MLFFSFKCEKKCESLCKQTQKVMIECPLEFGMRHTLGKVDIANLMWLFLSIQGLTKCENLIQTKLKSSKGVF